MFNNTFINKGGRRLTMASRRASVALLALMVVMVAACGPQAGGLGGSSSSSDSSQPRARKVLTIAVQREPTSFHTSITGSASSTAGGASNADLIVHDKFYYEAELEQYAPLLVTELPSIDRGTWRVFPDGHMETVWQLRPNIRWHDGTPFTTADVLFSFMVAQDPDYRARGPERALMESVVALDAQTVQLNWSGTWTEADHTEPGGLIPKHLLEDLFVNDKANFGNSTRFTTDFVGLGPYKLVKWEQGSHMEMARFDDYYQGRPALDTVFVRFIGDPNTMVANVLAGSADVVLPTGVDIEQALDVKQRWEGTGNYVRADPTGRLRQLELQYRPDFARPRNGLPNVTTRQGLYHAIDRNTMVEVMTHGLAPAADSWYPPNHGLRRDLEPNIPQFPYDPVRALQLLGQAGWTRGSDGILVHQPSGERFEIEVWANQGQGTDKEMNIVADGWKGVGAQVTPFVIPAARLGDREFESTHPGPLITNPSGSAFYEDRLHSTAVTSAANRWTGRNRAGYVNSKVDAILDRMYVTLDPRQRLDLHRQLLQEAMVDIAVMPLYWEIVPVLALKGVKGPKAVHNEATHNFFTWDKE
jgi:peptide/nickel transport system substrate-binding protein